MGICFSKKKRPSPPPSPPPNPISNDPPKLKKVEKRREAAAAEKKPVFVVAENKKTAVPAAAERGKKEEHPHKKKTQQEDHRSGGREVAPTAEELRPAPVRASSCTKEEVDAILIQCGRLSRSSSGKASSEVAGGGHHRRYSGAKRSYDFDNDKGKADDDGDESEKAASRPSPHRRTPSRERDGKRSGSRERGSGGGRRVSRSPVRRSDGPASSLSAGDKSKQPGKMVSVPAREKGGNFVAEAVKRSSPAVKKGGELAGVRSASPRSLSPANATRIFNENAHHHNTQPQSLSRSSSRKAEHSPYRRNPMAELDENNLRAEPQHPSRNQNSSNTTKLQKRRDGEDRVKKPRPGQSQPKKASENSSQMSRSDQRNLAAAEISNGIKGDSTISNQLLSYGAKEQQPAPDIAEVKGASMASAVPFTSTGTESLNPRTITRTRSSRRSSRDLDQLLGLKPDTLLNPTSYNSLLLEDIHHYHQQSNTAFSLPACISKACSILEAVADLNSSYSDNKSHEAEGSNTGNARFGRSLVHREPFVESEIVVKDDLMEPSLSKYVTVRGIGGELEPQESAGSNSFVGQPWASPWEPNSVDSTDRCWTSMSNKSEEVEEQQAMPEAARGFDGRGTRSRLHGSNSNSLPATAASSDKKREIGHRQLLRGGSGGNEKGGGRAFSLPVAAAERA